MFAVGLPVLAGMIGAAVLGIFLIPMLYVVFQRLVEGREKKPKEPARCRPKATRSGHSPQTAHIRLKGRI